LLAAYDAQLGGSADPNRDLWLAYNEEYCSQAEQASRAQEVMQLRAEARDLRAQLDRALADRDRVLGEMEAARAAGAAGEREADNLRAAVRHLEAELEMAVAKGTQAVRKHAGNCDDPAARLRADLRRLKDELSAERAEFEVERATWAEEKEKVLRYQRQLQLNYVQMFRRTRSLESEVESLTMELELEAKVNKAAALKHELHPHTIEL